MFEWPGCIVDLVYIFSPVDNTATCQYTGSLLCCFWKALFRVPGKRLDVVNTQIVLSFQELQQSLNQAPLERIAVFKMTALLGALFPSCLTCPHPLTQCCQTTATQNGGSRWTAAALRWPQLLASLIAMSPTPPCVISVMSVHSNYLCKCTN